MLLVSLLLLWLAIAKKFEPLLLLPIGFGGLLSNIPEAGLALTALESPAGSPRPGAAGGDCREAPLRAGRPRHQRGTGAGPAVGTGQMESLAVDMGYSAGVLAIFYKVAIGSGIAPLVIFMGVGAMTDFGPLLANPRTLLLGGGGAVRDLRHRARGADAELLRPSSASPCRRRRPSASSAAPTARRRFTCRASWRRSCWGPSRWRRTPIWRWCR
ncbi:oxaloacetate decarboxylase subunit beta [Klebsiella pneumoniae]|uniref:oxaloacetate decarboxylase (Na(+) extruding) n=1 Tax=Klebsiella pneumoniae TaxID=573 RepID=A0A377TJ52_KLEPN|nr:oxaloacetate decarboxylase subunit beta [Klebsiella pneumoniae]